MVAPTSWPLMAASCITNWPWPIEKGTRMISNSNCSRTTVRRCPWSVVLSAFCSTSLMIGSPSTRKSRTHSVPVRSAGPWPSRLTSRLTAPPDRVGIEADELEELAGIHGLGPQPARLAGLVPHLGGERLAALQHAARIEPGQLVGALAAATSSRCAAWCRNSRPRCPPRRADPGPGAPWRSGRRGGRRRRRSGRGRGRRRWAPSRVTSQMPSGRTLPCVSRLVTTLSEKLGKRNSFSLLSAPIPIQPSMATLSPTSLTLCSSVG